MYRVSISFVKPRNTLSLNGRKPGLKSLVKMHDFVIILLIY